MNTFAHQRAAPEVRTDGRDATDRSLILRPTELGWSLVGPNGELAFVALGKGGRQQCLEFAREHGVLWVRS